MGCFSWMYADTGNREALKIGGSAYVPRPDGTVLIEKDYGGFGCFANADIMDEVADWNREYLSQHPDFPVPQHGLIPAPNGTLKPCPPKPVKEYNWYHVFADIESYPSHEDVERGVRSETDERSFEYRFIGCDLTAYDDQNSALPYPIKICKEMPGTYFDLPASDADPDQGFTAEDHNTF